MRVTIGWFHKYINLATPKNGAPDNKKENLAWACDPIENQYLSSSQLIKTRDHM